MRALVLLFFACANVCVAQVPVLQQAEYFWDVDPGAGQGTAMTAVDGDFDRAFEQVMASAAPPSAGLHKLGVRVKGSDGAWGATFSSIVDVLALRQVRLQAAEYFWDVDPGQGNGIALLAFDGDFNRAFEQVSATATAPAAGLHKLGVRARGSDGGWGAVFSTIIDVVALRQVRIIAGEYFWDTDPGAGNGSPLLAFDGNYSSAFEQVSASASTSALAIGPHVLHVRSKGADNTWGPVFRTVVYVDPQPAVTFTFDLRVALQGCMGSTLMNSTLRTNGLVPLTEPYTAMGIDLGADAGATTTSAVMNTTFPPGATVVDWIVVEFHPVLAPSQTTLRLPLLLRRGGTVSTVDGTYPFLLDLPAVSYYVVVRHRNHLPIATAAPVNIAANGQTVAINFTTAAAQAYGTNAQVLAGSFYCMWSSDVNADGLLKYTGASNDRDPILVNIGGTTPNNTTVGYRSEDVNMDGVVKYTGANNDRDPILVNIGGTTPNNVRSAQLP